MNQIEPYGLWVGHAGDGRAYQEAADRGIRAIVQVAITEPPLQPPREFVYCRIPLLDGCGNDPGMLQLAIGSIATLIQQRIPTLVCCAMGMSRSPAITAAAIARVEHLDFDDCLKRVTKFRVADVSPGLWAGRSQISIATGGRVFLEENLSGSPKTEALAGAVVE